MDAFIAIAGKGQIEPIQVPVLQCLLPLGLVIKILAELARAEQQPVATTAARRRALLHEATKRRSEEHTSELQSLMRISYAVFCLKKKNRNTHTQNATI